ncbi:MAG: GGDEF domain-containing protein [Burkholderiales bacterium]|nr:GGDEF domain-containing protein [Burkholderiales bacterium]
MKRNSCRESRLRRRGAQGLAALALLLGQAGPTLASTRTAADAADAAGTATSRAAASVASRPHPARPDDALLALERLSRGQPKQALQQLDTLLPQLAATDPQRLLALALRGALQARHDDAEAAELTLRELDAASATRALAQVAAGLVRAELALRRGPLRRGERLALQALAQLPADEGPMLRIRLLRLVASAQEDSGRFDDAVRTRQQLIALTDATGTPWRRAEARHNLANTLTLAGQLDPARTLNREALALARAAGDALTESRVWTTESILLGAAGDADGELRALHQAIDLARQAQARGDEVLAIANLADHYLRAGQFGTALQLARQALPMARELADTSALSVALTNVGLALISLRERDQGLAYVRESMAIDERNGALGNLATALEELGGYLERAGYQAEALQAYRRQRQIGDEAFRRDQQQAILELQESFDNERRQRELALLQSENQLKQAQLLNSALRERLWLAGAAAGGLVLALIGMWLLRLRQAGRALHEGNALLKTQSERDPLTQLPNRRFLQRLMQPWTSGDAAGPEAFEGALLLVDLDHFKQVNDRHGHAVGDQVLVEVARRLQAALRAEDLVVRWGGEEFLVVAHELTQDQLQALAQRLLVAVGGTPIRLSRAGAEVQVSASIGYASFPTEPTRLAVGWPQAIDLVDTALYLAKAHGRNLAYGVRLLHAHTEQELVLISRGLEAAWSDGRVKLTPLRGPAPPARPEAVA